MNKDELGNKYGTNRCPKCGNPSLASEVCEKCKAPDPTKLIANKRAQLLAELSICDAATAGQWIHRSLEGGWDGVETRDGLEICSLNYNHPANAAFIATARTAMPDRIRENLRMLDALEKCCSVMQKAKKLLRVSGLTMKGGTISEPYNEALENAESVLRDIVTPKEVA